MLILIVTLEALLLVVVGVSFRVLFDEQRATFWKVVSMAGTLGDVQTAQAAETSAIQQLTTDISGAIAAGKAADQTLQDEIKALQDQIASGQPIDLSGVIAASQANTQAIQAADTAVNAAVANLNPPAPAAAPAAAVPTHLTPEGGANASGPGTPAA